jgi:hypothetical protein
MKFMDYSQFAYPQYTTSLLQAYSGRFGAAFVALHPFFRMPASPDWKSIDSNTNYPDNPYIRQYGQPVYWETIMRGIGCEDLRHFYIGMLTSIRALKQEYENREITQLIDEYTEQANVYPPLEGRFEPLLIESISQYISHEQADEMLYLPEFSKEPEVLSAETIIQKCDESESYLCGSLFDKNTSRLVTVDWDDFFTVFYGSSSELVSWLERSSLEGFFCDNQTLHSWCWQIKPLKPTV